MFSFLKEKLREATAKFSKNVEEKAEDVEAEAPPEEEEKKLESEEEKKEEERKEKEEKQAAQSGGEKPGQEDAEEPGGEQAGIMPDTGESAEEESEEEKPEEKKPEEEKSERKGLFSRFFSRKNHKESALEKNEAEDTKSPNDDRITDWSGIIEEEGPKKKQKTVPADEEPEAGEHKGPRREKSKEKPAGLLEEKEKEEEP